MELDPGELEAHLNLAEILFHEEKDPRAARPHYLEVVRLGRQKLFPTRDQKAWIDHANDFLEENGPSPTFRVTSAAEGHEGRFLVGNARCRPVSFM